MGLRGPKPLPAEELAKRGSHRAGRRLAEERGELARPKFVRKPSPPRAPVPGDEYAWGDPRRDSLETWLPLLLRLPHWDPRSQAKGFRFDGRLARRVIGWFERHVHHLKGPKRGQLVRLDPFQRALLANAFGWVYDTAGDEDPIRAALDGKRRFRKVLLYIAKKNGKSTLLGGLAAYVFTRLKYGGAKVLTAATHRGQARTVWAIARDTIEADPRTLSKCILWNATVNLMRDKTAVLEPISGEAKGEDGADCFFAILDELHRQKDSNLLTILDRGGSAADQSMFWILTTADEIRESPCNNERDYALSVRSNKGDDLAPGWNPSYLPAIYELDEGDDWRDEKNWPKANPGLGSIKSWESMRALVREAKERDDARVEFQRFDLNLRVENVLAPIRAEAWSACAGARVEGTSQLVRDWKAMRDWLLGKTCILGADLAETSDMISLVGWFPEERAVLPWYWACERAAEERHRKHEPMYFRWRDAGALDLVKENAIELDPVVQQIEVLKGLYRIVAIGIDRAKGLEFSYACKRFAIEPMFVGQGWVTMTEPCDRLVDLVHNGRLVHGSHPVLNWNVSNLRFRITGQRGKKPEKPSAAAKIDGCSALLTAMATESLLKQKEKPRSEYETREPMVG